MKGGSQFDAIKAVVFRRAGGSKEITALICEICAVVVASLDNFP